MMPFLDYLNHSCKSTMEAGLQSDGSYMVKTVQPVAAHHEVGPFILEPRLMSQDMVITMRVVGVHKLWSA